MNTLKNIMIFISSFLSLLIAITILVYYRGSQIDLKLMPLTLLSFMIALSLIFLFIPILRTRLQECLGVCVFLVILNLSYCFYRIYNWQGSPGDDGPWYFCAYIILHAVLISAIGLTVSSIIGLNRKLQKNKIDDKNI